MAVGPDLLLWQNDTDILGLLLLGTPTAARLRAVSLRAAAQPAGPIWHQSAPPDAAAVDDAWTHYLDGAPATPAVFDPRGDNETTDHFYARVAAAYRLGGHTPTTDLANAANVQRATAARWVHEARLRGHLPPAMPGKAVR